MYTILCFGLFLIGSLLMSALTLNVNLLSNAMAQEYDDYYSNSYYSANIQQTTRNMNVEQAHLKDFS